MVEPVRELKRLCEKKHVPGVSRPTWYARTVVRRLSIYVTWLLLHTRITANQVTVLQLFAGAIGAFLIGFGDIRVCLAGIFFLQIGYLLDNVDGEIARYRKSQSMNGLFIDYFNHVTVIPLIFVALGFHYYFLAGNNILYLVMGVLGSLLTLGPVNLATNETLIHLLESGKHPSSNGRSPTTTANPTGARVSSTVQERVWKRLAGRALTNWKHIIHYPGSMNLATVLILGELFFGEAARLIGPKLFTAVVLLTAAREVFIFARAAGKQAVTGRHRRIIEKIREGCGG